MRDRAQSNGIGRPAGRIKPKPGLTKREKDDVTGCLALLLGVPLGLVIVALLFLFAWNVGLVAIVAAAGGSVSKIGFWTALAGVFVIMFVRSIFQRPGKA